MQTRGRGSTVLFSVRSLKRSRDRVLFSSFFNVSSVLQRDCFLVHYMYLCFFYSNFKAPRHFYHITLDWGNDARASLICVLYEVRIKFARLIIVSAKFSTWPKLARLTFFRFNCGIYTSKRRSTCKPSREFREFLVVKYMLPRIGVSVRRAGKTRRSEVDSCSGRGFKPSLRKNFFF